jgi:hypothetical protein
MEIAMKKYLFCLILLFSSNFLYAEEFFFIYDELVKIVVDIYFKFYESNDRIPISFDDFLENLPRRENFNERDTHGLINIFINKMGWTFIYLKTDENNFELFIHKRNITVMYQSENDESFYFENGIIILNDYCGVKARYMNNNQ